MAERIAQPLSRAEAAWREKLEYLLEQEAAVAGAAQKFELRKQVEEAREKLLELRRHLTEPEPTPSFPDHRTRRLSEKLEVLYARRAELESLGKDTSGFRSRILDVKRKIREGGRLKAGDRLSGRFKLLEPIGHGGFAEVWKAYDSGRERDIVAVKVLHGQYAHDRTRLERFFRGARHMARLQHQGIVRVVEDQCEDGGFHFFVMEYLPGGDLRQVALAGRLTAEERLWIVVEVGQALDFAHSKDVIHRDVKPANILLDREGRAKLTDFDLVRVADTTGGTGTGLLGTLVYSAPELLDGAREAEASVDVFGLGMTALFALFEADLPLEVVRDAPGFIARLDAATGIRSVLAKAVAWRTDERFASVAEFCGAMTSALVEAAEERGSTPPAAPSVPTFVAKPRERLHEKTGIRLLYVPGREYVLGANDLGDTAGPVHRVRLSPFWIGKFCVTIEQYARFLGAGAGRFPEQHLPVVQVSWDDAAAFCRWAGLELLTEAEWEAAARGPDGRRYPWGDAEPSSVLANFDRKIGRPTAMGTYPAGAGPFGAEDQAGNVWEWCLDTWNAAAYRDRDGSSDPVGRGDHAGRVVRGGSWSNPAWLLQSAYRYGWGAGYRSPYLGFRVVLREGPAGSAPIENRARGEK